MRSQIWKQMVWVFCLLFLMGSCVKHDIFQGEDPTVDPKEPTKEEEDYIAQFENFENIQVSISSQHEGTLYSIYYEYPYEEGSLVKDPYLIGKTPIHMALEVPTHVKKLYILRGDGELIESDVKDITIGSDTKSSLRATNAISDEVLHLINNKYFPEKAYNVKSEDLYRCSDLKITETVFTSSFEKADIWLTYISDGGMSKDNMYGKIWFYTYPSEKMENLTLDDCTFYGKTNGTIQAIDFNKINQGENYIFYSKEEQPKAKTGEYTRIPLGRFDKEPESGITKTLTYSSTQLIMPYIDNGKGPVSKNVKNTDLYPYVLDIPYSENKPFHWCIENKSIDNAYNFDQDYRKAHGDWYETPKDESLVIKFTTSDEEKKDPENKE